MTDDDLNNVGWLRSARSTNVQRGLEWWDRFFLDMARHMSTASKDPSTQTGAVLTMDKVLISVGYNGFPANMYDNPERYANREEKYSRIVHCEINALIFAARDLLGATLYTYPFMSCDRCAVQMLQAGVMRFVAPKPTSEQLERWGPAFERSKQYILECGSDFLEIDLEQQ